jgi:hypothetical protein
MRVEHPAESRRRVDGVRSTDDDGRRRTTTDDDGRRHWNA